MSDEQSKPVDDMSQMINTVHDEQQLLAAFNGWNGAPQGPAHITVQVWWIDPYWYVSSSNGLFRVMSQDQVTTDDRLVFTAGEHVRLLLLDQWRTEGHGK